MKNGCVICQHLGIEKESDSFETVSISNEEDPPTYHKLKLCYEHEIELFKLGQRKFMMKYAIPILDREFLGGEDQKFLSLLKLYFDKYQNEIY